jgi:hypothetical protein
MALLAAAGAQLNFAGEGSAADAPKPEPRAGWLGVFPELTGYQRTFSAPVVTLDKAKKPVAYRQTAKYEWTGGAIKKLEVTLARDPEFKQKYAAETVRKEAKEVRVGKRTGWLWNLEKEAQGKRDAVVARLVVPLGEDKALILEARGAGPWEELTGLAERFDLARAETALEGPPRTEFGRNLDAFRALKKGMPYADVAGWVGEADEDVGQGVHILVYKLPDGSRVLLGFADLKSLMYVKHEGKDGKTEELVK